MGWKQRISVVVLVILAAVPASKALCALGCGSAAETASAHHGLRTPQSCDEPARPSTGVHIEALSEHDCSAHGWAVPQVATAAAKRIGLHVAPILSGPPTLHTTFNSLPTSARIFENTSPPGWAPPAIPLILRV